MRSSTQNRVTKETDIHLSLCLDGGDVSVNTGIGFFDHMLTAFAVHGGFGLQLQVKGDLHVDCHHNRRHRNCAGKSLSGSIAG